ADALARRLHDRTIVDARAPFRAEVPVEFAPLIKEPSLGYQNTGLQIVATRFEQEDMRITLFGQPPRRDRASGPGTNDNVVVAGAQRGAAGSLVGSDGQELVRGPGYSRGGQAEIRCTSHEGCPVEPPRKKLAFQEGQFHPC